MNGLRFGSLIVLEEIESRIRGHRQYICLCDCGNKTVVTQNNLLKGNSTRCFSCCRKSANKKSLKYNVRNHKSTYQSYRAMIDRCSNSLRYVNKNITICDEWLNENNGFLKFIEDMGERPVGMTLDRIDNSKGYNKSNCRWANVSTQNRNKGKRKTAKHSEYIGVSRDRNGSWLMQITADKRYRNLFVTELEAATYYDNIYELNYGVRPNNTVRKEVIPLRRKSGGITFCRKTNKFRVRITIDGIRKNIGFYDTHEEACTVLEQLKNQT